MTSTSPGQRPTSAVHVRRRVVVGLGALVVVLGGIYAVLVLTVGTGVPRGATVLGVQVGGESPDQAATTLTKALAATSVAPVAVMIGDQKSRVTPATAGLSFDAGATLAEASGRTWNPFTLLHRLGGSDALDPVIVVDQAKLTTAVAALASETDNEPTEPAIKVNGTTVTVTPGVTGQVMDQAGARDAITAAYLRATTPIPLPVVEAAPTVSADAAAAAAATAKVIVSAPVTVHVGAIVATIPAATIAEALSHTAKDGALVAALDGAVLRAAIAPRLVGVETPGHDATWNVASGKPVLVAAKTGRGVNPERLATDVLAAASQSGGSRTIEAAIGAIPPKLTTEKAKTLGVVQRLSSFTQHFPYAAYRVQNIGQAARSINGTLLMPGDTFSLNKTLGERTVQNGYTTGFVVGEGGVFKQDLGGGVSTSATATWTAAFFAGLERVHTQAHSIWISRYQPGLEATVAWGQFDMSFRNDTPHAVLITTIMTDTSITVQMWGTRVYDKITDESSARYDVTPEAKTQYDPTATCHAQTGGPGFSIDVFRVFYKAGKEVKREKITTHYKPSPTVECKADPTKSPSPSPSASGTGKPTPKPTTTPGPTPTPSTTKH